MNTFQSSLIRAIAAIAVGALLVKYREQTVTWLTISMGVIFFVSGVISCISYFIQKRHEDDTIVFDAQGRQLTGMTPSFPVAGIGSLILGIVLALMPSTFVTGLMYVLAAILILGAINQFVMLAAATRYAHIGLFWWLLPSLLLLIGLLAVVRPQAIAAAPLLVLGWAMIVYGVVEFVNALKIWRIRRHFRKMEQLAKKQITEENATNCEAENAAEEAETF